MARGGFAQDQPNDQFRRASGDDLGVRRQQIRQIVDEGRFARTRITQQPRRISEAADCRQQRRAAIALAAQQAPRPFVLVATFGMSFRRRDHVEVHVDVGQRHRLIAAGADELRVDHAQRQAATVIGKGAIIRNSRLFR